MKTHKHESDSEQYEKFDAKYMQELNEFFDEYFGAVIDEIFIGVSVNLGMSEKKARELARSKPTTLQKAGFFSGMVDKIKRFFGLEVPKFRYTKKIFAPETKPMSSDQWDTFNSAVQKHWKEATDSAAEAMGISSFMLGRETTNFRKKKKPYQNKSLFQVATDQFGGEMPKRIDEAYKKYNFNKTEKQASNAIQSSIAMYVTQSGSDLKEAIRKQVQNGIDKNLSPAEVASNLYWNVQKDETLMNKYTAEGLKRNWYRISSTEMAMAYETGIIAPYEDQAMESMRDPSKAVYFTRSGGSCDWCAPRNGTIVRLVPKSIVKDTGDESLQSMGIEDPNTDIAIWSGKNNVGRKKQDWLLATPAHPHNKATFQPIDLQNEWYNPKTKRVEALNKKQKNIPQQEDFSYQSKLEKESGKPKKISDNKVLFNGNEYVSVSPEDYNDRLEKFRTEGGAIPINSNSPAYRRIFGDSK